MFLTLLWILTSDVLSSLLICYDTTFFNLQRNKILRIAILRSPYYWTLELVIIIIIIIIMIMMKSMRMTKITKIQEKDNFCSL